MSSFVPYRIVIRRVIRFNPQSPIARTSVGPEKDWVGPKAVRQVRLLFPTHAVEAACSLGDDVKPLSWRFGSAACAGIPAIPAIRGVGEETGRCSSNAQVQEESMPSVWPDLRAERWGRGLVPAAIPLAGLRRRREGKAPMEPPDPVNDAAVPRFPT